MFFREVEVVCENHELSVVILIVELLINGVTIIANSPITFTFPVIAIASHQHDTLVIELNKTTSSLAKTGAQICILLRIPPKPSGLEIVLFSEFN